MIKMWKAKESKDKEAIYFLCLWDKLQTSSVAKFSLSACPPLCMLWPAAAPRRENMLARLILSTPAKAHMAPAHHHDARGRPRLEELGCQGVGGCRERQGTCERERMIQPEETGEEKVQSN